MRATLPTYDHGRASGPRVPVSHVQEALRITGVDHAEVCWRIGWTEVINGVPRASVTRLRRAAGLQPYTTRGKRDWAETISEETAARIVRAVHLFPRDVGL